MTTISALLTQLNEHIAKIAQPFGLVATAAVFEATPSDTSTAGLGTAAIVNVKTIMLGQSETAYLGAWAIVWRGMFRTCPITLRPRLNRSMVPASS